ncbi:MAG: methyltransferase domain-containing protein [Verrucomicrobia bacterium]|nr:methyltransferase domain-containing protein [Verrucomicrobiota bacterium]
MTWQQLYLRRFYLDRPGWKNGTEEFHEMCRRFIMPRARILEIGPSSGGQTSGFLAGLASELVGLDVDDDVQKNPHLTRALKYDGTHFPVDDASFDAVVLDYVLEHVEDPPALFREIHRVLRPGGTVLFRTPNARHYVSVLGRILPDRLSVWARRHPEDHRVYPRHFRCNTARACRRVLGAAGFRIETLRLIEKEPSYGMGSRILFLLMMAYERAVNSTAWLAGWRANLLVAARKPEP